MLNLMPSYISWTFGLTTLLTLILFLLSVRKATSGQTRKKALFIFVGLLSWLVLQAVLSLNFVYNADPNAFPPKIMILGIFPTIIVLLVLFMTSKGKAFIDSLPILQLTYLNVVRVPVEIVLFWLYQKGVVPQLMTFEGRNFDILAGISAPLVGYLYARGSHFNPKILLAWNVVCLMLLVNIVIHALLSAPSPFQQLAFDQPNIAILYFPFSWLPTFVVPIVLFGHLVSIRQLVSRYSLTLLA
jgi:hypothetical protein